NLIGYAKLQSHFVYMATTTFKNGFGDKAVWKIMGCRSVLKFKPKRFNKLEDLRTTIAEHDSAQLCIGCGSPDLHKGGEIKEPKMCLDCFAEMVGFTRTSNGFLESDHVTDIRNHLSPSTKVVDV
ncbi:MAG: hypothetical protein ACRC0N_08570, partial [Acinetobacter johnsonii]